MVLPLLMMVMIYLVICLACFGITRDVIIDGIDNSDGGDSDTTGICWYCKRG